jgi:hypothetical protein
VSELVYYYCEEIEVLFLTSLCSLLKKASVELIKALYWNAVGCGRDEFA